MLYDQPYGGGLTFGDIKELANAIGRPPRRWTPEDLWTAYETLDASRVRGSGRRVMTDLVSLVRFALDRDEELVAYPDLVSERFEAWLAQQANAGAHFGDDQLKFLELIRDHLAASLTIGPRDLMGPTFSQHGGLSRARQLFGPDLDPLLEELTELWVYDLRTNRHFTLKQNPLTRADLDDFVSCYRPGERHRRVETERFKRYGYDELIARDKVSLDVFWLRDESLTDTDDLPAPGVIAAEVVEDLESALDELRTLAESLEGVGVPVDEGREVGEIDKSRG